MNNIDLHKNTASESSAMTAGLAPTAEELRIICDTTVRLTEIRQRACAHLCVENFAQKTMKQLLLELQIHKRDMIG